jgi:hypothetical protein
VRDLAQVGILFRSGAFHRRLVLNLHADICIRAWLILAPYIELEREKRHDHSWNWAMQNLTVLSLKYYLRSAQNEIAIFDPCDPSRFKIYDSDYLGSLLDKLRTELGRIEPKTGIRRTLRWKRTVDEFKYRKALDEIEKLPLPPDLKDRIGQIKIDCGVR